MLALATASGDSIQTDMRRRESAIRQRSRPEERIGLDLREAVATVKRTASEVGVGRLELTEHHSCVFPREPARQMGQEGILDAQSQGARQLITKWSIQF